MNESSTNRFQDSPSLAGWRLAAARIVEELISQLPETAWDSLLDLRAALLRENPAADIIDLFLRCRKDFEAHAYLPFYRLRTLLAASLCLQANGIFAGLPLPPMEMLMRQRHGSLAEWTKQLEREWFEMGGDPFYRIAAHISVVESTL